MRVTPFSYSFSRTHTNTHTDARALTHTVAPQRNKQTAKSSAFESFCGMDYLETIFSSVMQCCQFRRRKKTPFFFFSGRTDSQQERIQHCSFQSYGFLNPIFRMEVKNLPQIGSYQVCSPLIIVTPLNVLSVESEIICLRLTGTCN